MNERIFDPEKKSFPTSGLLLFESLIVALISKFVIGLSIILIWSSVNVFANLVKCKKSTMEEEEGFSEAYNFFKKINKGIPSTYLLT